MISKQYYTATSLVTGFMIGKFGLFGLQKDVSSDPAMNWIGFVCVLAAMAIFFFIKPTLEEAEETKPLVDGKQIQDEPDTSLLARIPPTSKSIVGITLAIFSGVLYGVNILPMSIWSQKQKADGHPPGALDFVFSHFTGIYLFSTAIFLGYNIVKRPPQVFPQSILPSYISGAMWGIAQCGLMMATGILGYTKGFPIGSAGPLVVSSLWSVLYFREIRGTKNILLLLLSFAFIGTGITLLALSH